MTPLQTLALALLSTLTEREAAYDAVNRQLRALDPEFPTHLRAVDHQVESGLVKGNISL